MIDQPELIEGILSWQQSTALRSANNCSTQAVMESCPRVTWLETKIHSCRRPCSRDPSSPGLKAECNAAHAKGKYLIKHTDGNTWRILDMMIEAGIDAWQGIQPRIGMSRPELQKRYRVQLCFWGGVDVDTLVGGTEEQVAEEVRIACQSAPSEGGLVLTCGNSVMVDVKYRNYMSMLHAAKLYGTVDHLLH